MKKKKIELNKKLLLSKESILALNEEQQSHIAGGTRVVLISHRDETRCIPIPLSVNGACASVVARCTVF